MEILDRYLSKSAHLYSNDSDFDFMLLIVIGSFLVLSRIVSWCSFLMRGVTENPYCNFRTWISSTVFRAEQGRGAWSSSHILGIPPVSGVFPSCDELYLLQLCCRWNTYLSLTWACGPHEWFRRAQPKASTHISWSSSILQTCVRSTLRNISFDQIIILFDKLFCIFHCCRWNWNET